MSVHRGDTLVARYAYNAFGERVRKTVYAVDGRATSTRFLYDRATLAAEIEDASSRSPRAALFADPRHPCTRSPLAAVPVADPRVRKLRDDLCFAPIPLPVFAVGHMPAPSRYDAVGPDHLVLRESE